MQQELRAVPSVSVETQETTCNIVAVDMQLLSQRKNPRTWRGRGSIEVALVDKTICFDVPIAIFLN